MAMIRWKSARPWGVRLWLIAASAVDAYGCSGESPSLGDPAAIDPLVTSKSDSLTAASPTNEEDEQRRCPATTTATGATGSIEIAGDFIQGAFFADDTILRSKAHPECVAHIESAAERLAPAGTLTIGSDLWGNKEAPLLLS